MGVFARGSRNKALVFLTGWSYGEVPSNFMNDHREKTRKLNSLLRTIMDFFFFFFLPRKAQKNKIKAENDVIDILDFEVHHLAPEVVLDVLDSRLSSVIDQFRKIKIQP